MVRLCAMLFMVMALPFAAYAQGVQIDGQLRALPEGNDFADALPQLMMEDVTLLLTERSRITFTELAAESGNSNSLIVTGLGALTERRDFGPNLNRIGFGLRPEQLTGVFSPGPLDPFLAFTSDFGDPALPGEANFAIFANGTPGQAFSTFYLVYNDTLGGDGDFDDYIIRVDVEPFE